MRQINLTADEKRFDIFEAERIGLHIKRVMLRSLQEQRNGWFQTPNRSLAGLRSSSSSSRPLINVIGHVIDPCLYNATAASIVRILHI